MTKEQLADRIREEFRKHAKNDPEGWPLIAAGKVLAEIRETGVEPKYWFYTIWYRMKNPHSDQVWTPCSSVANAHPLVLANTEWREDSATLRELVSWQEITKEEYEQYKEQNR